MKLTNWFKLFAVIALLIILSANTVSAGLGQSAGVLNFGNISRGGKETLSYGVLNTNKFPVKVDAQLNGAEIEKIATVEPKTATIRPDSYIPVYVTVRMPLNAEPGKIYSGHVMVRESKDTAAPGGTGISFGVAVIKNVAAVAAEEIALPEKPEPPKQKEPPYLLFALLLITAIVVGAMDPFGWRKRKNKRFLETLVRLESYFWAIIKKLNG